MVHHAGLNFPHSKFQNHFKQRTLFDNFLVTRKQTPTPALARLDDPRDDEPGSQTDVEQAAGTAHLPELSSVEHLDDVVSIASSPIDFTQGTTDVDNGALAMHWPFLR